MSVLLTLDQLKSLPLGTNLLWEPKLNHPDPYLVHLLLDLGVLRALPVAPADVFVAVFVHLVVHVVALVVSARLILS